MKIDFDPQKHAYRLDGIAVPNVTRVLGDLRDWSAIPRDALERKREIGTAVHLAIELDLLDDLDRVSLDSAVEGYFDAWRRFRREKRFECYLSECRVASKKFRYAGTLDLVGEMNGKDVLIDAKVSAEPHPATTLQTAAYLHAGLEMGFIGLGTERFALYLQSDGRYRLEPHPGKNDFAVFLSCLARYNWCLSKGLIKEVQ